MNPVLLSIAQKHLNLESLETRNLDRLDFSEQSVGAIKAALEAAYQAGIHTAQNHPQLVIFFKDNTRTSYTVLRQVNFIVDIGLDDRTLDTLAEQLTGSTLFDNGLVLKYSASETREILGLED